MLGHHYQRDEIIKFADLRGDSYKLSTLAAARPEASYIVFCGVHFMAESADILSGPHQQVILPNLEAGCSMANMAQADLRVSANVVRRPTSCGPERRPLNGCGKRRKTSCRGPSRQRNPAEPSLPPGM